MMRWKIAWVKMGEGGKHELVWREHVVVDRVSGGPGIGEGGKIRQSQKTAMAKGTAVTGSTVGWRRVLRPDDPGRVGCPPCRWRPTTVA
jgi:hypothetical protein